MLKKLTARIHIWKLRGIIKKTTKMLAAYDKAIASGKQPTAADLKLAEMLIVTKASLELTVDLYKKAAKL